MVMAVAAMVIAALVVIMGTGSTGDGDQEADDSKKSA